MENLLLSKINIGGVLYNLKDAYAREEIAKIIDELNTDLEQGIKAYVKHTGVFADDNAVKSYVDSQVGSINKFDVVIGTAGNDGKPNVAASADTMYKLYLIQNADSAAGEYIEFITIRSGDENNYTYNWEAIGSTKMSLTGYVTEGALTEALAPYELKSNLKSLAYKDSASGTVAGDTISGVKATGTGVTGVTLTDSPVEKDFSAAGEYTPVGNVNGTTVAAGKVDITVTNAAANASIMRSDYQPAGTVSVILSGSEFNKITSAGTAASFEEGAFTPATLDKEDVTANYATEGIVGAVEGETLTFTAAGIQALSATKVNGFTGGSKATDTFVANIPATMETHNVGVQSSVFTGEVASELRIDAVSYQKHDSAVATFTGEASDISATFIGTKGDVNVAGKYTDTNYTAQANTGNIELAVGDIAISEKSVTVQ